MTDTVFYVKKVANIPDNVKVVHKFGEYYNNNNKFFNDCGIIYISQSRIFYCVMIKNVDEEKSVEIIGFIVNQIYNYVNDTRAKLGTYKQ